MLNLIDMNITRLFKTKALYITSVITFAMLFMIGFFVGGDFVGLVDEIAVSFSLSMVGIFSAVYSDEERKSGFLKNLETSKEKKRNVFFAKIPAIALYSVIILFIAVFSIAIGLINDPAAFAGFNVFNAILFFMIQVLLLTGFGVGFMAIYELARGMVAPIVTAIMFSGGMHCMIINALAGRAAEAIPALRPVFEAVSPNTFQVVALTKGIAMSGGDCPYIEVLCVGIILLAVYSLIGANIFRKRDTF